MSEVEAPRSHDENTKPVQEDMSGVVRQGMAGRAVNVLESMPNTIAKAVDWEKLTYLIEKAHPENFSYLVNATNPEKLARFINDTETEAIIRLTYETNPARLAELVNMFSYWDTGNGDLYMGKLTSLLKKVRWFDSLVFLINNAHLENFSTLIHYANVGFTEIINQTNPAGTIYIPQEKLCALISSKSINILSLAEYLTEYGGCYISPLLQMLDGELKKKPFLRSEREFIIPEIIEECKLG